MIVSSFLLLSLCAGLAVSNRLDMQLDVYVSKPYELQQLSDANNDFGVDLYQQIRNLENAENIFFSPWSVSQCLSMAYAGALGNTKTQMAEVLKFKDINFDVHRKLKDLIFIRPPGTYTLKQANKIFGSSRANFKANFLSILQNMYQSPLVRKNFHSQPERSRAEINDWVAQQTEDKIKDLLPSNAIKRNTVVMLVNALYFKAQWQTSFYPGSTTSEKFYLQRMAGDEDKHVMVPMMSRYQARYMRYTHNLAAGYKMIELPYLGRDVGMFIVLPDGRYDVNRVAANLSAESINRAIQTMRREDVNIKLPKFKIRTRFELKRALERLGMRDAFSNAADFRNMTRAPPVKLGKVYHQAYIDLDEKGTEAAAATGLAIVPLSASFDVKEFTADHPFLFFIRENRTGTILFMGKIGNPAPRKD